MITTTRRDSSIRVLSITDNGSGDARITFAGRHLLDGGTIRIADTSIAAYNSALPQSDYNVVSPTVIDMNAMSYTANATGGRVART